MPERALEAFSRQTDHAEKGLSCETGEVTALRASVESVQQKSALVLGQFCQSEADVALGQEALS
jgi:hypothetical protein